MIIMALDHVRDFFHRSNINPVDPAVTYPALFFTRWITHFCAPGFLFLSGVSASIAGQRRTRAALSVFLAKRGCWLLVVEMVVMTLAITFDPLYHLIIWQVIWAIGWSMIILALLQPLGRPVVTTVGFLLFLGHNITDLLTLPAAGGLGTFLRVALTSSGSMVQLGPLRFLDLYAVLPWTALMLLGFACGQWCWNARVQALTRQRRLRYLGLGALAFFIVLRALNGYGDPQPWSRQAEGWRTFLSFLNVNKYPPSLAYSTLTVGALLVGLSLAERMNTAFTRFLEVYGKVPFFYYVLHFYLVHLLCAIAFFATGGTFAAGTSGDLLFAFRPTNWGFPLGVVYAVWALVIALLYWPCRRFGRYKATHRWWWLSYL